ncbi:ubiquitin-conjugating enzyme family protein [Microcoleus sp. D3_18a_C4]|uniref:ubiquitin-conjugating enzyme family protein n=1 Tax=Microcoleus sp. D3_18a_C4 TaxID=3055332 RepID=UPI002FD5D481
MNAALKRIDEQMQKLRQNPPYCASAEAVPGNPWQWQGLINGPVGSPYEDGTFHFEINFSNEFPYEPPKIVCTTKICHPNISSAGEIGLQSLSPQFWSPSITVTKLLKQIVDLFKQPILNEPESVLETKVDAILRLNPHRNRDEVKARLPKPVTVELNAEVADLFKMDEGQYRRTAADWTKRYAL